LSLSAAACGALGALTLAPAAPMRRLVLTNCAALRVVHAPGPVGGGGGGGEGRRRRSKGALNLSGCAALPADARERLAALVAAD
jgi:hypothetical protein